jgi:branched-chain amino acid transport system ATP-binding protein
VAENASCFRADPEGRKPMNAPVTEVAQAPVGQPLLELVDMRAGYGPIEVLHGVDLHLQPGEVLALLGPNGGGKTTTLKVCSGLIAPNSGELRLAGRQVNGADATQLAAIGVCSIPEGRGIFANLSVRENLWLAGGDRASLAEMEEAAYARFPRLGQRRKQLAGTMSGGEQQMLALARALGTRPVVLLLDELSMGLAPLIVAQMYETVAQLAEEGIAVLVAEQFARVVLPIAHRAALMLQGRVVTVGAPAEIEDELSSHYLGG